MNICKITGLSPKLNLAFEKYYIKMSFEDFEREQLENALQEYSYIKLIGEGVYGKVFLMEKRSSGQQFAVKKISCFGQSQYELSNALNEVRILASLDHPHIVRFYSGLFDKDHDNLYIFLQYANGGDLSQLIIQAKQRKKRVSQALIWKILLDIATAVQYLHKNNIAHRDIKPANIFKEKDGGYKLGDLNVSKILPKGSMAKTRAGSPFYLSPQVWSHEDEGYHIQCDIWSLGVVVYELCSLKVPFQVQSPQQMEQKLRLTPKKSLPKCYSSALNDLVQQMLQINPKKRISAQQIIFQCLKNMRKSTDRQVVQSQVLMKTLVVPQTNERWVNLVHKPRRSIQHRSNSSRKSTQSLSKKSENTKMPTISGNNLLQIPGPQLAKRTSKTSKGSRAGSKQKEIALPPIRKYSIDIDISNLSSLIQRKSNDNSKNSESPQEPNSYRNSRIRRNIVCQYIKQVRQQLPSFD